MCFVLMIPESPSDTRSDTHLPYTTRFLSYQFHTKDDIVLAVVRPVFDDMARLVRIAESIASPDSRRDATISGFVELAVRHRRIGSLFYGDPAVISLRSEEHTSELQSLMRISYAVFCWTQKQTIYSSQ